MSAFKHSAVRFRTPDTRSPDVGSSIGPISLHNAIGDVWWIRTRRRTEAATPRSSTTAVDYFSALVVYLEVPPVQLRAGGGTVLILPTFLHLCFLSGCFWIRFLRNR